MKKEFRKERSNELTMEQVQKGKYEILSVSQFAERFGQDVTNQAIDYVLNKGKIDFVRIGRFRNVVLTTKTLLYVPNPNKNRKGRIKQTLQIAS